MIHHVKGGYKVVSHRTGKNLGTYKGSGALEKAQKRLVQLKRYAKRKEGK